MNQREQHMENAMATGIIWGCIEVMLCTGLNSYQYHFEGYLRHPIP